MWLTSKRPAEVRTAWCSSIMPEYWTGISQPPKSTILAHRARWTEFSGVVRSEGAVGMKIQANSRKKGVSNGKEQIGYQLSAISLRLRSAARVLLIADS